MSLSTSLQIKKITGYNLQHGNIARIGMSSTEKETCICLICLEKSYVQAFLQLFENEELLA